VDVHPLEAPKIDAGPLEGVGIVVTRPQRQAAALAKKLAAVGATPLLWPAIVILPPRDRASLERAHETLATYDIAVFVSANAVEFGAPDPSRWPSSVRVFAPGPGTAEALSAVGIAGVRIPLTTFDSEGLLALPELRHVEGARAIIFRGQGGRELLGDADAAWRARRLCLLLSTLRADVGRRRFAGSASRRSCACDHAELRRRHR